MSTFTIQNDEGEGVCDGCDVWYTVIFGRNVVYDKMDYCPFCGDEIEEIVPFEEPTNET